MANELTVSCSVRFSKSGREADKAYGGIQIDVTGTRVVSNMQTVGTSEEALVVGDVGTAGFMIVKNLDSTNYVTLRAASAAADLVKLKAGEVAMFRLASNTPYALANTAPVDIEYVLVPN